MKVLVIGLKGLPAKGGAAAMGEALIRCISSDAEFTVCSQESYRTSEVGLDIRVAQRYFMEIAQGAVGTFIYYIQCMFFALRRRRWDLIHLHHAESGFITPLLSLFYPCIVTIHGLYYDENDPKFSSWTNVFFRFATHLNVILCKEVICVSQIDYHKLKSMFPSRNISYIPNGVETSKIEKVEKEKFTIVFSAARVYSIKGLHYLLDAIELLDIDINLNVIGDLNHETGYKERILAHPVINKVKFLGLITDKSELRYQLSRAELFVFPSTKEAMSMMLLEVVDLSIPIIASDIPQNTCLFSNNEMLFFKSEDSKDLAIKITDFYANKHSAIERCNNAKNRLETQYNWTKIGRQYLKIYREL